MDDHDHDPGQAHGHEHDHAHGHDHSHAHERYSDRPHSGHVVLELGEEIGALIVHTDPALLGKEVEISLVGGDGKRQHKEVLERVANGHSSHVLVFDNLVQGDYLLWIDDVVWARGVRVRGGEITEIDRRESAAAAR